MVTSIDGAVAVGGRSEPLGSDADHATPFAWLWLRHTAEREDLRLVLYTTTVPDRGQAAASTS